MKILALIPARGLSDRVPYKNLVDLCGHPLIEWTIHAAQESRVFDEVVVSTEDTRIERVAKMAGAETIVRPGDMAQPTSPTFDVVRHAFGIKPCDLLMLLQPTSPLRTAEDIYAAADIFDRTGCDSVVSITEGINWSAKMMFEIGHAGRLRPLKGLIENGAIYGITGDALRAGKDWYSGICYGYEMPPERSIDIDTLADLEIAREAMKRRKAA